MKFLIWSRVDGSSVAGDKGSVYMILDDEEKKEFYGWSENAKVGDYLLMSKWGIVRVKDWK